jgi:hypothetical protein
VIGTIAAVTGLSLHRYGPSVWARGELLLAQRQCLTFDPPPHSPGYALSDPRFPSAIAVLSKLSQSSVLLDVLNGTDPKSPLLVFSHRLRNRSGDRLVLVYVWNVQSEGMVLGGLTTIEFVVILPASPFRAQKVIGWDVVRSSNSDWLSQVLNASGAPKLASAPKPASVDFAHPIADDPAGFRFSYRVNDRVGSIYGRLTDTDNVEIKDEADSAEWIDPY